MGLLLQKAVNYRYLDADKIGRGPIRHKKSGTVASLNHFSLSYPVPNKDPPYIEPANHELERSRELRRLDRSASPSVGRGIASTRCTEDRVSDRRIVG